MHLLAPTLLLYLSLLLDDTAHALRLPLSGRWVPPAERRQPGTSGIRPLARSAQGIARRSSMTASADLSNLQDLKYFTNISLNDAVFPVLIDTGRCVLFLASACNARGWR